MADNAPGLLARLFKRKPTSNLLAELHSRAINRPLLIDSDLGASLIRGYLSAPQAFARIDGEYQGATTKQGELAVIDISGPLVSRAVTGPSGTGPLSYEDIRGEFDEAMDDDDVSAIVLRLDSPGGEAAQMFDLSDHIYHARGKKPIIAMIDDAAYSAAFGMATAADQIWITRTGGVGSVGVVAFHLDQSEMNSKIGVKVEYIHAGDRKIDLNPHNPLSDAARARMQAEVDRLYGLFVSTVARNLGLTTEQVIATQAMTYHGEKAIETGFAHKLGTFNDLVEALSLGTLDTTKPEITASEEPNPILAQEDEPGDGEDAPNPAQPADKVSASQSDEPPQPPAENPTPIAASPTTDDTKLTDPQKAEIRAVCKAAGLADVADDYIQAGTSPTQVRADLMNLLTTGDVEIQTAQRVTVSRTGEAEQTKPVEDVYARRKQHTKNHLRGN
ncbi:MAG: S49 family peptidase [Thiomicrospira sp.]|jgi:signal peptide peptidase SppA|nr:S49 family peptidase [Thiomicrospira sp.]